MNVPQPEKMKSGVWKIRLRLGGKAINVFGITAADCKREATAIKGEHLAGNIVQKKCTFTTTQAIDRYIAKRKLSPSTVRGYRTIQRNVFQSAMNQKADSVDWQSVINNDPHSPKTIRNAWGFIASVLKESGIEVPNVRLPAKISNDRPFLQPEQIPTFLDAIYGQNVELAALLGLHSLRRSEILDVTVGDVDLKRNIIHVRGSAVIDQDNRVVHKAENKNAASTRDVPIMIPRLAELVKQNEGKYLVDCHPNSIYRQVNKICEENNLPLIGCHGLRHSFVSLAWHLGWDEMTTMKIAGYSDFQTMRKIYTHLADADKMANIKSMTAFYASNTKGKNEHKSWQNSGKTKSKQVFFADN